MTVVRITPTAERHLDEIYDYIANQNPETAGRLLRRISAKAEQYAEQPLMGTIRDDLSTGIRCFQEGNYVAFYRIVADGIELLMVVHGSRDIPAVFRSLFP